MTVQSVKNKGARIEDFHEETAPQKGASTMKYIYALLVFLMTVQQTFGQTPTYQLVLRNDSLTSSTVYAFDIYVQRTNTTALELSSLQLIHIFNAAISSGTITYTIDPGSSELNAAQQPSNGKLSVVDNELRIASNSPPGAGGGTVVPVAPGLRVGRFRMTSSIPFANRSADIAWKNSGANPVTKVNAYVGGSNTPVTDSTGHLNSLSNTSLSPLTILSGSARPSATVLIAYADTLVASGGTLPFSWTQTGGSLPSGFSLSSSGVISGTTTAPGAYNFTANVTDSLSTVVSKAFSLSVNPGTLHHFVVEALGGGSIGSQTAGTPFFIQILAKDTINNTATGFSGTAGVTSTGAISEGGTTGSFTNGVLSSHSVAISNTGLFTLTATRSGGSESGTSNSFQVNPGAPKQIVFVQQPTAAVSHTVIAPAITVQLKDSLGNNSTASGITIGLSLSSGTGTLSGTTPRATDTTGLATFSGMSIDLTGSKNLTASGTGLTPAVSNSFTISAGTATQLAFVQQPTDDTAGTIITPPLTVQLKDAAGNDVASSGVLLSIALTTGSGTLGGTTSRATNAAGLATFDDLSINLVGSKNLTAASTGLASAASTVFTISPGPLNNFLVEASGGGNIPMQTAGVAFWIQITARDTNTNTVTGFSGTADITSTGTLSSGGGTTPAFVSGVLSSRSVTIANGGSFTITATKTAGGTTGTSNAFVVNNPLPTTTSISPATKTAGDPAFTITVRGTNFVAASVVRFNGSDRVTTFDSSTQVRATIPAGDLTTAGAFNITMFNPLPGGGTSNPQTFTVSNPVVNLKLFLEGAYRTGSMITTLRNSGFLPLAQPYNAAPWSYPGTEGVGALPVGLVDWILIEVRTGTSSATRVARRAAFVKTDGSVVDTNGVSPVTIPGILTGNYYIVVRHRNHLAVMTANAITLNDNSSLYDFTTGLSKYFGGDSRNLGGGKFGLYSGDYSADSFIDADDFVGPDNELFQSGYRRSDLNMDGFIDAADFAYPDNNVFKGTNVPQ